MTTKTLLSLATVALLAATAQATTVESTTEWLDVDASAANLDGTGWTKPSAGTATRDAETINVDTAIGDPLKYTKAAPSGCTSYRITGTLSSVTLNATVPTQSDFGGTLPVASLVAVADNKWYGWHLTGESAGAWVALTGDGPTEDGNPASFTIKVTTNKVSYTVGTTVSGTFDNAKGTELSGVVGLAGFGSFGDFSAVGLEEFEMVVPEEKVAAVTRAMGISDMKAETLNTEGANGLTVWESIVLGLDSPAAVPYTAPVQVPDEDGKTYLGFKIGNANAADYGVSGSTAKFTVYECYANGNPVENGDESDETAAGGTAKIEANSSGVKYYKIKIKFE